MACGFPSRATGMQITAERKRRAQLLQAGEHDSSPEPPPCERHFANDFALFFPEGLFAVITLLAAPFWALNQLSLGHYGAGLGLAAASAVGLALAVIAWRHQNKWLLYAGVLVVVSGSYLAMSLLGTPQ
mgnify:FL=1